MRIYFYCNAEHTAIAMEERDGEGNLVAWAHYPVGDDRIAKLEEEVSIADFSSAKKLFWYNEFLGLENES